MVRTKQGLETCRCILSDAGRQLVSMEGAAPEHYILYNKVRNMIDVAMLVVQSAARRKESLGGHFLMDGGRGPQFTAAAEAMESVT